MTDLARATELVVELRLFNHREAADMLESLVSEARAREVSRG